MATRKLKGPSHFCEWVVGTTIEAALGPIPKSKPPKNRKREVVRVEVTTDDESEEDTVRITYPRTGRTAPPPDPEPDPEPESEPEPAPVVAEAKTVIKKVRFQDGPIKSALKQTLITSPAESSDEISESGTESESEPESDSSQSETMSSSDATDSDAESSDNSIKKKKRKRRKRKPKPKQKQIEADSESDWDSDPDPTCKCHRCVKGREILRRIGKKKSKEYIPPSPETSESEADDPPKHKRQPGKNKKKRGKRAKQPEVDSDASDSANGTSESEPETPPRKKEQQPNKKQKQGKQKGKKKQEPASEPEASDSEPETPKKKKKQQRKANAKKGAKKVKKSEPEPEPEETDEEASGSDQETEDEAEQEEKPEQQNKSKQKNKKTQNAKQAGKANKQQNTAKKKKQKAPKEANKEPEVVEEAEVQEEAPEATKGKDQGKFRNMKGREKAQPTYRDGVKKGNYPEGLPGPHMRRPQLIEPIRAQVVQTERVIETPEDPAPNAYYDPEHNVMRVYHGPVYGNHQSNALYPERNGFNRPLPMGTPHPMQNPYYYGFNNPKQYPNYSQMSPYQQHYAGVPPPEAYSHVPITQGIPPPPWYSMGGPPAPPPAPTSYQGKPAPASSKDKASQNNNVGPPSLTVSINSRSGDRQHQNRT